MEKNGENIDRQIGRCVDEQINKQREGVEREKKKKEKDRERNK